MNSLRLAQYVISSLPLLLLLCGYGTIRRRNGGRFSGYARNLADAYCIKHLAPAEHVLVVSRPNRWWQVLIFLVATIGISSMSLFYPPTTHILFITALACFGLFFFNWLHLQAIMSSVVVTDKAVYWCDCVALPPEIRVKRLGPGMEVFYSAWSRDQLLWVDREQLGRLDFANSREIHKAVLHAVAALGAHKPPPQPRP